MLKFINYKIRKDNDDVNEPIPLTKCKGTAS